MLTKDSQDSQYRVVSIGYVAENKLRSTDEVEISLIEKLPFLNGELVGGYEEDEVTATTSTGASIAFKVKMSNTITASWGGDGSNRVSSPDVRRGEEVEVLQFGDTDKYFWRPFNEPGKSVRRRETVITAYSNSDDETQTKATPENSYYSEINTHDGVAALMRTNKSNGEKYAYGVEVLPKEGRAHMSDDIGNTVEIDSENGIARLENAHGAKINLVKGDIVIECPGLIKMKSAQGEFVIPTTQWTGNIGLKGNLGITGNMIGEAGGTYTFNGAVITTSTITNNGKDIGDSHKHTEVEKGGSTSGGVA